MIFAQCTATTVTGRRCQRPLPTYRHAHPTMCPQHELIAHRAAIADRIDPAMVNNHPTEALEHRVAALEHTNRRLAAVLNPPPVELEPVIDLDNAFAEEDDLPIIVD